MALHRDAAAATKITTNNLWGQAFGLTFPWTRWTKLGVHGPEAEDRPTTERLCTWHTTLWLIRKSPQLTSKRVLNPHNLHVVYCVKWDMLADDLGSLCVSVSCHRAENMSSWVVLKWHASVAPIILFISPMCSQNKRFANGVKHLTYPPLREARQPLQEGPVHVLFPITT